MNQLLVLLKQLPVGVGGPGLVSHDADNRGKHARTHLPDMKVSDERIPVALNGATDFIQQVAGFWRAVEQDAAGIPEQRVSPGEDNRAAHDADYGVDPGPAEELARQQRANGRESCECVREDVKVSRPTVQVPVVVVAVALSVGIIWVLVEDEAAPQMNTQPRARDANGLVEKNGRGKEERALCSPRH